MKRSQNKNFSLANFSGKNSRGALEISFGWLFAIIAGIVIIFLAIYLSSKLIGTQQTAVSAETGQQIGVLLDPMETSFESAQTTSITIPTDTRIDNICIPTGDFGQQVIQLDQKNFGKWVATDTRVGFENKYIFSESQVEGQKFYIFSEPFNFPFKIADLMYITSADVNYCFVGAPNDISTEISQLNQSNLKINDCSDSDVKVCFGQQRCNINVDFSSDSVEKNGTVMYFSGVSDSKALMYAAIFSNSTVYECQVKRLMLRLRELSSLYANKELITEGKGCDSNLGEELNTLGKDAGNLNQSSDLSVIQAEAESIDQTNNARVCMLW